MSSNSMQATIPADGVYIRTRYVLSLLLVVLVSLFVVVVVVVVAVAVAVAVRCPDDGGGRFENGRQRDDWRVA